MEKYFGTDGFRGEVNVDLTAEHAFLVGKYLGYYYSNKLERKPKIVIGKDTRKSGSMLESALFAGATSTGGEIATLGVTTTPSVSYVTRTEDFDLGIMITASHNPYYDNGIKLMNTEGTKLSPEILAKIEAFIDQPDFTINAKGAAIGSIHNYIVGKTHYTDYLSQIPKQDFRRLKIGLDLANGASYQLAKEVYSLLGADVSVINDQPDGLNINVACGSTDIAALQKHVIQNHLDVGFAFDGDADRCIAVDHTGKEINGDLILYAAAVYLNEQHKLKSQAVVMTAMSNLGVLRALEEKGITTIVTDVGDKHVAKEIHENGYSLGGEQSGHLIFSEHSITGDGILTSLMVLEIMTTTGKSLHELTRAAPEYPQILKNKQVKNKNELLENEEFKKQITEMQKRLGADGRIFIRPSGTEPLIRIMVEAKTEDLVEEYLAAAERVVDGINE